MPTEFYIVIALIGIVAVASIVLGFGLGRKYEYNLGISSKVRDCHKEFMDKYYETFKVRFEQQVEAKSNEIATEKIAIFIESLPEEQQQWFLTMGMPEE